ncbi:hypothetical protein OROGR_001865 [Orobanche gracilis]
MRYFEVGIEGKLKESIKGVDHFAREVIKARKNELVNHGDKGRSDLLTAFMGMRDEGRGTRKGRRSRRSF